MLVQLDKSIFAHPDPHSIVEIVGIVSNTRHLVFADDTTPEYQLWAGQLPAYARKLQGLILATSSVINAGSVSRSVRVHSGNSNWADPTPLLSVADAKVFLMMPFKIFVENNTADKNFLFAYMTTPDLSLFRDLLQKGWLQFTHGGGTGDLQKQLDAEVSSFPRADLRIYSVFDNDGLKKGRPSSKTEKISRFCQEYSIPHHQLLRRSIENYVHSHALSEYAKNQKKLKAKLYRRGLDALRKMPDDLRDYFNMKEGIHGDRKQADRVTYSSLNFIEKTALQFGFGKHLSDVFQYENFSEKQGASTSFELQRRFDR